MRKNDTGVFQLDNGYWDIVMLSGLTANQEKVRK